MSDVKCPKCPHLSGGHAYDGCRVPVHSGGKFCPCNESEASILRAAYAASEAALADMTRSRDALAKQANQFEADREYNAELVAERDATITFLRGELAEARADYDDVLRERNEARAEVERLRDWNQSVAVCREHTDLIVLGDNLPNGCYVCEAMERNTETAEVMEDIAAERQRIAEWYADRHCHTKQCGAEKSCRANGNPPELRASVAMTPTASRPAHLPRRRRCGMGSDRNAYDLSAVGRLMHANKMERQIESIRRAVKGDKGMTDEEEAEKFYETRIATLRSRVAQFEAAIRDVLADPFGLPLGLVERLSAVLREEVKG